MPPKKKKESKKSGKKKSGKKREKDVQSQDIEIDEPELNKEFFILHIKDLERKLRLYRDKAAKFQTENDEFMKKQKDLSQEKHDLISFLEKNLMNRGDEFSDLKDRFFGLIQAKEAEKNQFETTLQEIRSKMQESKDQLTAENSLLSAKLAALDEFKVQKEKFLEEFAQLEQEFANKKSEHQMILEAIETKSSHDHDRLKREIVTRINMVAADFRKISHKQTSETTKRTIRENVSIQTQLSKMDDKNIELMQENEQLRQKVKTSLARIKEIDKSCNDLASKNLSHTKLLHLLMIKHQEHQEISEIYQKETNIIQSIEEENESVKRDMEKKKTEIEILEDDNSCIRNEIFILTKELEEIKNKSNQARQALVEAVHHLQELLQSFPLSSSAGSLKSTQTQMSKRSLSRASSTQLSNIDIKEWGNLQQRTIAEEKLQQLLDALDYEENDSRASSASDIKRKEFIENDVRNSPSISIATRNASAIRRLSPEFKEKIHIQTKPKIKILSDYEIKSKAKLQALQMKKGFCVPGLLQMVPHMDKHIPTNLEKTQELNKRLNGMNIYNCEDDIEKPIKSHFLKPLNENKLQSWTNKLSS